MAFVIAMANITTSLIYLAVPAHLLAAGLSVVTAKSQRISPAWLILLSYPLVALDWYIAPAPNGVVTFGTAWMWNITSGVAALLLVGRRAVVLPCLASAVVGIIILLSHPHWPVNIVLAATVTGPAIAVAAALSSRTLYAFVRRVDADSKAAATVRRAVAFTEAASRRAAESARLLHDTVINTLVAIANGTTISDISRVRRRCARDIESVRWLLDGFGGPTDGANPPVGLLQVAGVADTLGLEIVRRGMTQDDIDLQIGQLPPAVTNAIHGAMTEALLNVAKHSGTKRAQINVYREHDELIVRISDCGIGFSGHVESGRGLAESVFARCAEAGVRASMQADDMCGTTVTLAYAHAEPVVDGNGEFLRAVAALQERGCWIWAAAVVAVGVLIAPSNPPGELGWLFALLVTVGSIAATAWYRNWRIGRIGVGMQAMLILATPVIFLFSLVPVHFGKANIAIWQTLGPSVPLIILLFMVPRLRVAAYAIVALAVTATVTTLLVWRSVPTVAGDIPLGALTPVVIAISGLIFYRGIERIILHAAADNHEAEAATLELGAVRAAASARTRWQAAGLHASIEILDQIASSSVDPAEHRIRAECAREERRLRQLTMLSPDLLHMGPWLIATISEAHDREVDLTLRTGDRDVIDESTAALLGAPLLSVLRSFAPGSALTVAMLPTSHGLSLTVVGPTKQMSALELPQDTELLWTMAALASQTIVEVVVAHEAASATSSVRQQTTLARLAGSPA